jgi:putative two-component system response regulator
VRPYKKAFTHEEAETIIFEGGKKHFDPGLVDVFMSVSNDFNEIAMKYTKRGDFV